MQKQAKKYRLRPEGELGDVPCGNISFPRGFGEFIHSGCIKDGVQKKLGGTGGPPKELPMVALPTFF